MTQHVRKGRGHDGNTGYPVLPQLFQVSLEGCEINHEGKLNTYIANQPPHNLLPPLPPRLPLRQSHHLHCPQRQTLQYNSCGGKSYVENMVLGHIGPKKG